MPKSLESCERVCNLLLLLELLREQQPGLKLGGRASLLSLVGVRRGRRPRQAQASFDSGLATFQGRKPTSPLDVIIAGLDQLLDLAPLPPENGTPANLEGLGLGIQQGSRPPVKTVRDIQRRLMQPPLPVPRPLAVLPPDASERRIVPERTLELLCAGAIPLLIRGVQVLPHPILKAGAIAAIYGCGLELAE